MKNTTPAPSPSLHNYAITHTQPHKHIFTYKDIYTTYIHIHAHIHINIYIYIYIHTIYMQKYIYTIYNTNTYTQYTSKSTCIHA